MKQFQAHLALKPGVRPKFCHWWAGIKITKFKLDAGSVYITIQLCAQRTTFKLLIVMASHSESVARSTASTVL